VEQIKYTKECSVPRGTLHSFLHNTSIIGRLVL
jgi:hypothetical protein